MEVVTRLQKSFGGGGDGSSPVPNRSKAWRGSTYGVPGIVGISKSIGMRREYRTALISAAVTGTIDVREEIAS